MIKNIFPLNASSDKSTTKANLALVVIRNPIKQYESLVHFIATISQNKSLKAETLQAMKEEYQAGFKVGIQMWKEMAEFWMNEAKEKKYPIYFVRFEDITTDKIN